MTSPEAPAPSTGVDARDVAAATAAAAAAAAQHDADRAPRIHALTNGLCALVAAAAAGGFALRRAPSRMPRAICALASAAVGSLTYLLARWAAHQREYARKLKHPEELADPDSKFVRAAGIRVHYKENWPAAAAAPSPSAPAPGAAAHRCSVFLLHGFGSWLFSYRGVRQPLADRLDARVVAFDRPAFGLTERPRGMRAYTRDFNAELTPALMRELGFGDDECAALVGHSLGALIAARTALGHPRRVAALVLVAPAIVASDSSERRQRQQRRRRRRRQASSAPNGEESVDDASADAAKRPTPWSRLPLLLPLRYLAATASVFARRALLFLAELFAPVALFSLRALVSRAEFWRTGLRSAWHDASTLTRDVIDGYRLPDRVKGWDAAFLRFSRARFASPPGMAGLWNEIREAVRGTNGDGGGAGGASTLHRLKQLRRSVPVLIVHGERDRLVPLSNSRRLAEELRCECVVMERCGHLPHEERPEAFVEHVVRFLSAQQGRPRG